MKGRRLVVAEGIRPSSSRLKEALFSILGERIVGAAVLELFAGSGAIGIEAWSRGAARVTFVESGRQSLAALRRNVSLVGGTDGRVLAMSVGRGVKLLAAAGERFDIVFADPPYADALGGEHLAPWLALAAPGGVLAIEHRHGSELPERCGDWCRGEVRGYGDSSLSLYEEDAGSSASGSATK